MRVTKNYVSAGHAARDVLHSVISWFTQGILYFPSVFLVFSFYQFCFNFILCLCEFFIRDVVDVGKFVFPGFGLFFRPQSRTVLLLKSSWLNHYTTVVQNPRHCQYGCALYVRRPTQTIYVRRQDFMEHMVICWIPPCIGQMCHINGTLFPPFLLVQKMFSLEGRAKDSLTTYCTSNSPLLASSNVKGRIESRW